MGFARTEVCGAIEPSSKADAVPADGVVVSRCVSNGLSNAHKRSRAEHMLGDNTCGAHHPERNPESEVSGPMPSQSRDPEYSENPFNSSIAEWGRKLRGDYVPSRKRFKPSVIDSGAAMVQRKGGSSPCLIPGNGSQGDALRLARDINPFERLLANASSPAEQACVSFNCQYPKRTKRERHRAIERIEHLSGGLRASQIELARPLPLRAPARKLHIPLIQHLVAELEYTDVSLDTDLVAGMPSVGLIPRTSSLPEKVASAAMALPDVRGAVYDTTLKVLKSSSKSSKPELKQK